MLKYNIYLPKRQKAFKNANALLYQHANNIKVNICTFCRKKFNILDGPPYANGEVHIGHIVNKLLKQIITLSQQQIGKSSTLKTNWDCHGLPIELEVLKSSKPNKSVEFACKIYALNWIKTQIAQFKLVGLKCYKPQTSMHAPSQIQTLNKLYSLIKTNYTIYGKKSIIWSLSEKSSMSENDTEQKLIKARVSDTLNKMSARKQTQQLSSGTITKLMLSKLSKRYALLGKLLLSVSCQTWLLPWTSCISLPAYGGLKIYNNKTIAASKTKLLNTRQIRSAANGMISALTAWCVFNKKHTPVCDWQSKSIQTINPATKLSVANKLAHSFTASCEPSSYSCAEPVPSHTIKKEIQIINKLIKHSLIARCDIELVSVFSSNRSKGSAINWINKQLYIRLSTDTKTNIIKATNHINFKPEAYKTILTNLIQTRPDWILSRQRRWGTPLCLIINAANKTILDEKLKQRLNALFYCHKESQWLRCKTLYNKYSGQNWKKLNNVIDVWFDASSVYALRPHRTKWDLIIEGIDQHRGWFQSMLINAVLTTGAAPVKTIITHGFIMQDPAKKLSKSLPSKLAQTLLKQLVNLNVNIVRTWVCTIKWAENQVMCANWLLKAKTAFLKINNTLKWGLDAARSVLKHNNINQNLNTLTPTDKLILHKLKLHNNRIIIAYANYNLNKVVSIIVVTCDATLSTCFNIIKDQTYCDFSETQNRLNSISVLKCAVSQLVVWLTPIMPSVCYELKTQLKINNSVINKLPNKWFNKRVALNWKIIDNLKKLAASVRLRSGRKMAELCINVYICDVRTLTAFKNINTSLLFGCSKANIIWISHRHKKDIKLSETQSISVWKSKLKRCARCRRLLYFNEY